MDNFTHSLAGWALGQAGLKAKTRKGLAALILGANMPDIDVFFGWVPWEPLAMHRGFTHGLVGGVLVMPPMLAGLLWLLDRWQVKRGAVFKSGLDDAFRLAASRFATSARSPIPCSTCRPPIPSNCSRRSTSPGTMPTACSSSTSGCGPCSPERSPGAAGARSAAREWQRPVQGAIAAALIYVAFNHRPQPDRHRDASSDGYAGGARRSSPRRRRSGSGTGR